MSTAEKPQRLSPHLRRLLILKLWLIEKLRFDERQLTLVWAAVIGVLGALVTHSLSIPNGRSCRFAQSAYLWDFSLPCIYESCVGPNGSFRN